MPQTLERHRAYMRGVWYPANRDKQRALVSASKREMRRKVQALKLAAGCADCGYNAHPEALDFDHVTADKRIEVSELVNGSGWNHILAEIAKCEVVCANCHRVRTAKRRRNRKALLTVPVPSATV